MGSARMRKFSVLCVLAMVAISCCAASEVDRLLEDSTGTDCAKAFNANEAVCEAYGQDSRLCGSARAQFEQECSLGESESPLPASAKPTAAPGSFASGSAPEPAPTKTGPALKDVMAPVLEGCTADYSQAKLKCKRAVSHKYKAFKAAKAAAEAAAKAAPKVAPAFTSGVYSSGAAPKKAATAAFTSSAALLSADEANLDY